METIKLIKELKEELQEESIDFATSIYDYELNNDLYICDYIMEYIDDNLIDIYYHNLWDFAYNHTEYVENALYEMGGLSKDQRLESAFTYAQYNYYSDIIYNDIDNIIDLIALLCINDIENENERIFTKIEIETILSNIDISSNDKLYRIKEEVQDAIDTLTL